VPAAVSDAQTTAPWLVVGLGNPGDTYATTRHNIGAMVVDLLAERCGGRLRSHKGRADVLEGRLAGRRVVLARSRGYMNESGGPVTALRDFYKIDVEHLIVVHDELDLDFGTLRLKRGGGDAGHNGLRSITRSLGPDYLRVRVGIGRPPGRQDPADYVLKPFSGAERKDLDLEVDRAADAVEALLATDLETAQQTVHAPRG
jgi:PTH1 family peptidyl-tRNA hydrolase